MFNRIEKPQISEPRIAEIERVVTQHGEMLNALKDHVISNMDDISPLMMCMTLVMSLLPPDKRKTLEDAISEIVRNAPDREHAAKMRQIFEEKLHLTLSQ
ncbi:hypothetical protein SAMN05443245_3404 [Paraburkholderia fungorum]|uniref:Uncharacterized protein n=1 Tax=Paraburkholderia fungorum TaxID=134537 RepID=A0A1H1H0G0_9BURK|nr:hypothetical protein [Paraburkholderia fungorum]SDR18598.1 hypothetical protein SAMN05443245_3404 [Paraburkholderia fungorum]